MVEFALPANSKVVEGKTHKAPAGAKNVRVFKVYRYDPDAGGNPRLDSFEIDMDLPASCTKKTASSSSAATSPIRTSDD